MASIWDIFGEAVNTVTHPFGVELFPGGTLMDDTADAMAKEAWEANQKSMGGWDWLANYGKQFLTVPRPGGAQTSGGTTGTAKTGGTAATTGASEASPGGGVALSDLVGQYLSNLDLASRGLGGADYTLDPTQTRFLNQNLGKVNVQRARAIDAAKRALAQRGITSGDVYDATMRRLAEHYDQTVMDTATQYALQAREQRMADAYRYLGQLMQQAQFGTGLTAQGLSGGQAGVNYLTQAAQAKQAEAEQANQNFVGALMYGLGLAFPGWFKPKTGGLLPTAGGGFAPMGTYGSGYGPGGYGGFRPPEEGGPPLLEGRGVIPTWTYQPGYGPVVTYRPAYGPGGEPAPLWPSLYPASSPRLYNKGTLLPD